MIAAGQIRIVNHARFTGTEHLPINVVYYSNEAYYDKITGLLVASIITDTRLDGTKDTWTRILNSTTAFTGLNSTGPTILPTILPTEETTVALLVTTAAIAMVALTMIAAAITQHKQRKTTTH
jgi:hypothetical protein